LFGGAGEELFGSFGWGEVEFCYFRFWVDSFFLFKIWDLGYSFRMRLAGTDKETDMKRGFFWLRFVLGSFGIGVTKKSLGF